MSQATFSGLCCCPWLKQTSMLARAFLFLYLCPNFIYFICSICPFISCFPSVVISFSFSFILPSVLLLTIFFLCSLITATRLLPFFLCQTDIAVALNTEHFSCSFMLHFCFSTSLWTFGRKEPLYVMLNGHHGWFCESPIFKTVKLLQGWQTKMNSHTPNNAWMNSFEKNTFLWLWWVLQNYTTCSKSIHVYMSNLNQLGSRDTWWSTLCFGIWWTLLSIFFFLFQAFWQTSRWVPVDFQ